MLISRCFKPIQETAYSDLALAALATEKLSFFICGGPRNGRDGGAGYCLGDGPGDATSCIWATYGPPR